MATSVAAMLAQREQELARLREDAVQALETKMLQKCQEVEALQAQLATLERDFQHNLGLLDGRDAELDKFRKALQAASCELDDGRALEVQMKQAMADAEAALKSEHAKRVHAETLAAQQSRALTQELQRVKSACEAAVGKAEADADARCAQLATSLADAEAQRRNVEGRHASQLLEAQNKAEVRAEVAEQLASRLEREGVSTQQDLRTLTAEAAALRTSLAEHEARLAAQSQTLEASSVETASLRQQLQHQQQSHVSQLAEVTRMVDALRNAIDHQKADAAEELARVKAGHVAHLAAAERQRAEKVEQQTQLRAELEEARLALEMQHAALQEQLDAMCAAKDGEMQAARLGLEQEREACAGEVRQLEAALLEVTQELDMLRERHAALQDYVEAQQEKLASRRGELARANTVHADLSAQLEFAERKAALLAAGQGPRPADWEAMLRCVTEQRDRAQAAAQEVRGRLSAQESELAELRQQLAAGPCISAAGSSWGAPKGAAPVGGPGEEVEALRLELETRRQQNAHLQAALHAVTAEMQQLQARQLEHQQEAQLALADLTNHSQAAGKGLERVKMQLSKALTEGRRLAAENERLMEMSNSLRAAATKARAQAPQPAVLTAAHVMQALPPAAGLPEASAGGALPSSSGPPQGAHHLLQAALALAPVAALQQAPAPPGHVAVHEQQQRQQQQQQVQEDLSTADPKSQGLDQPAGAPLAVAGQHMNSPQQPERGRVPKGCSFRSTASQRAKQWRQQQQQQRAASPIRPRVRNHNQRDDEPG